MIVKVCGVRTPEVARAAVEAGADWIGLVLEPRSPRHVEGAGAEAVIEAVAGRASIVGVMVSPTPEQCARAVARHRLDALQVHGAVDPLAAATAPVPVIRAVNVRTADQAFTLDWWPDGLVLLDAAPEDDAALPGGTGRRLDLDTAAEVARRRRILLAGGLGPGSVAPAVAAVRPEGVDASSALESAPGVKDPALVSAYVREAREAAARLGL